MIVKRAAILLAGLLCFGFSGPDTPKGPQKPLGPADWKPSKRTAGQIAGAAEATMKTFQMVAGGVILHYKAPTKADPLGYGYGRALMNEYFWSPTRFRFEYLVFGASPQEEYLAADAGIMKRLGPQVGEKNTIFSPKQSIFNVATDAQLVEAWPKQFTKYLFSQFVGGNATLSRYVRALSSGVGGYSVSVKERTLRLNNQPLVQYQILATRPARGNKPASTVEMIFNANPGLPVTINTTYGKLYDLKWRTGWYNNAKLPGSPFKINQ